MASESTVGFFRSAFADFHSRLSLNPRRGAAADDRRGHPPAAGGASAGGEKGGGAEEEGAPRGSPLHAGPGRKPGPPAENPCVLVMLWIFNRVL